jgi:hypothetical protein
VPIPVILVDATLEAALEDVVIVVETVALVVVINLLVVVATVVLVVVVDVLVDVVLVVVVIVTGSAKLTTVPVKFSNFVAVSMATCIFSIVTVEDTSAIRCASSLKLSMLPGTTIS